MARVALMPIFVFMAIISLMFATEGRAACVSDPVAAQKASDFIGNPSSLLSSAGAARSSDDIANDVENFVTANPQALPAVIALLRDLVAKGAQTSDQQKAIGTGLGKAAKLCQTADLNFAGEIQSQLGGAGSSDANTQYAVITGNDPTRSVAAGGLGSGSGGAVGGQTSPQGTSFGGSSTLQTFQANSVSNNPTSFFSASVGSAGSIGGTSTTTTIVCTVSSSC